MNSHNLVLPLPPENSEELKFEMEIYARFMRHLRHVPCSRDEVKVLSSIQFTADMMDISDALVSKTLVDLGLRAPRSAFPTSFLDFIDKGLRRRSWEFGSPPEAVAHISQHWQAIGEDMLAPHIAAEYSTYNENVYA